MYLKCILNLICLVLHVDLKVTISRDASGRAPENLETRSSIYSQELSQSKRVITSLWITVESNILTAKYSITCADSVLTA